MKLKLIFCVIITVFSLTVIAQLDPQYINNFGRGKIAVSHSGFPEKTSYNPEQFTYKDSIFYLKAASTTTVDLRAIFKEDKLLGTYMTDLKKEKPQNLKHKTADLVVFRVWCSHNGSTNQVTPKTPWPTNINDLPLWAEPCGKVFIEFDTKMPAYNSITCVWADNYPRWGSLIQHANSGDRYYIALSVAYEYSVPGGQTEYKWNKITEKWEPEVSAGGIGYVYSDPISVCTIQIE